MTTVLDTGVAHGGPPVIVADATTDPVGWLARHRADVASIVDRRGAALVRGLGITDETAAATAIRALATDLMAEREPFAPRTRYAPGIYSSTSWPSDQPMCMHHELSYAVEYPTRLIFCCLAAPDSGGATALADAAAVLRDLPADLVDRFDRHGWQLRRTYNEVVGMSWQTAFGTGSRDEVEARLRADGVDWEWGADGLLRTSRTRPAVVPHPVTGERLWFNQIAFLNEWTMDPAVREYLTMEFGPDGLPFTTLCGDGGPLDRDTVDRINAVYEARTVREPWQPGDVLVVDNLRMAHSREPYEGDREIVVGLADPVRRA